MVEDYKKNLSAMTHYCQQNDYCFAQKQKLYLGKGNFSINSPFKEEPKEIPVCKHNIFLCEQAGREIAGTVICKGKAQQMGLEDLEIMKDDSTKKTKQ